MWCRNHQRLTLKYYDVCWHFKIPEWTEKENNTNTRWGWGQVHGKVFDYEYVKFL